MFSGRNTRRKNPTRITLNVQGVGYEVFIPVSSFDHLSSPGKTCRILTHHHLREDSQTLFGFYSEAEREVFQRLINISGIGPKIALSALSSLAVRDLTTALVEGDVKRLSSISGVGKKMAERMVVELRDKFSHGETLEAASEKTETIPQDKKFRDAAMALISLGYKQLDARKMIQKIKDPHHKSVEELIKEALAPHV